MREKIRLDSSAGTGHFYTTTKNKRTMTEKFEIKKFDPNRLRSARHTLRKSRVTKKKASISPKVASRGCGRGRKSGAATSAGRRKSCVHTSGGGVENHFCSGLVRRRAMNRSRCIARIARKGCSAWFSEGLLRGCSE